MSQFINFAHRTYLRTAGGRDRWHLRHYRPSVTVVKSKSRIWFEENGVQVEAYPVEYLAQKWNGRCNLVLSGPSVRELSDIGQLAEDSLMCVNGSPQLFGNDIPPMLIYHANDSTYIENRIELFLKYAALAEWTLIDYRGMFKLLELAGDRLPSTRWVVFDNWGYPFRVPLGEIQRLTKPSQNGKVFCSDDLSLGLGNAGTVAYTGAQFAWLTGFDSLYFYGLDLTDSGRAYQEGDPLSQMLDKAYEHTILPGFELLARESSKTGFKMFNCNPSSRLPASVIQVISAEDSLKNNLL